MNPLTPHQYQELERAVVSAYNESDLSRIVRFTFGQPLEQLVKLPATFRTIVFDLIAVCEQRGWTTELVRAIHEERATNPNVSAYCQAHARFVFTPRVKLTDLTEVVQEGLTSVQTQATAGGAVADMIRRDDFREPLRELVGRLQRLRQLKTLHACLHDIQFKFLRLINSNLKLQAVGEDQGELLANYCVEISDSVAGAAKVIDTLSSRVAEQAWIALVGRAIGLLRDGGRGAADGCNLLDSMVRVQPSRINALLTELLTGMQLDPLAHALRSLVQVAGPSAPPLSASVEALGGLSARMRRMLDSHREWQVVDNSLVQIATELRVGLGWEVCGQMWAVVSPTLADLLARHPSDPWSIELARHRTELDVAVAGGVPTAGKAFERVRSGVSRGFYAADERLKELAGELSDVGGRLTILLGV